MPALLVTDSRYQFVPPHEGEIWPRLICRMIPTLLRRKYQVTEIEVRGAETIRSLMQQRHGVLLAPNHCRMTDALVLQQLSRAIRNPFYIMASAHLFRGSRRLAWMLRRMGAFSVYREGIDRQAIQKGIDVLVDGRRPLILFPEGALSQANDHLNTLQEGFSFIARSAASRLERSAESPESGSRRIFTVPIAIRYLYQGDIEKTAGTILTSIERRLSWKPFSGQCLVERIYRVGSALLALKEQEFLGTAQTGELDERLNRLINHLLDPLEKEWSNGQRPESVILRVKELRRSIMAEMVEGNLPAEEMARRWDQLERAGFAQSLSLYPARYVASNPTAERILETVERFHEHLNGDETPNGPMKAVIETGEPVEVSGKRDRSSRSDALLTAVEQQLTNMLQRTESECHPYQRRSIPEHNVPSM